MIDTLETRQRKDITEILKYVLFSDYVVLNERLKELPLSVLIIAPVGEGKTSITDQYKNNNGILELSKVTEYALLHEYMDSLKNGVRLYYPDLVNTGNMKEETVNSLMSFLKDYINWDGVKTISFFNTHIPLSKPLRGSLMGTMASRDFLRMSRALASSGFLSRVLLIGYFYKRDVIVDIMTSYAYGVGGWDDIILPLPKGQSRYDIKMNPELIKSCIPHALKFRSIVEGYHIRALQQMVLMCKAKALSEERHEVNDEDVKRVLGLYAEYACKVPGLNQEVTQIMRQAWKAEQSEIKSKEVPK